MFTSIKKKAEICGGLRNRYPRCDAGASRVNDIAPEKNAAIFCRKRTGYFWISKKHRSAHPMDGVDC